MINETNRYHSIENSVKIVQKLHAMNNNFYRLLTSMLILLTAFGSRGQESNVSWEALTKDYTVPCWFAEAKFGIWLHWGAQTQPEEGGGWYARHMYMQDVGGEKFGERAYPYHIEKFGHPSEVGFKEVIHSWKAEHLDTDALVSYFKGIGAKYFMVLANHHDHFDNFNSSYHPWNSVNVGPGRDLVGEFECSAKKYKIPFGVSSHDDRYLHWWLPSFGSDATGPKKGVPYDGNLTKADGKGKWWEGLDPADLYGLPPAMRTPEWVEGVKKNWLLRHQELVTKYDVDMIWFDGYGFPYGPYGKEVCRTLFENSLKKNGRILAVASGKIAEDKAVVKDIECGVSNTILEKPWQSIITSGGGWFYKKDREIVHNARTVIETLCDVISKNGNLLLNVELFADGTIPTEEKAMLDDIGNWLQINGEAVYATKPWGVYGDNLHSFLKQADKIDHADLEALKEQAESEQFNQRTVKSLPYGHDEVRFTIKGDKLYVFVLNPAEGEIQLPSLGLKSGNSSRKIKSVKLLGARGRIRFKQTDDMLMLSVPDSRPTEYSSVFEMK